MTLNELAIGDSARIEAVFGEGVLRQHLLDMGVIPGAEVTLIKYAPMGDPMEIKIHGYELTLRLDDAKILRLNRLRILIRRMKGRIGEYIKKVCIRVLAKEDVII